jgi:hypothetical protein
MLKIKFLITHLSKVPELVEGPSFDFRLFVYITIVNTIKY